MGEESPKPSSAPTRAVFLSYSSQDAEAAQRICEALRSAGIEVWFDQSELRGGDAWDRMIRKQIKACALFIPVISDHTHERREGYFRLEWKLALDRSNLISATRAFLVPVVIDDTREDDEEVPEKIREVHWTRLEGGQVPAAFIAHVRRLLEASAGIARPSDLWPSRADDSAERRQVTVLFAHLAGPATRPTQIDPEDLREVIAAYHRCVADIAGRYDGHVGHFFGERIVVYFGYPRAHEDDPERAIRVGLESIAQVATLDVGTARLQMRVAVATGLVVVGDPMESGRALKSGIVGETPDLAARLLDIAEPGTVIIAESTRRLIGDLFELEDLGAVGLKGTEAPVRAWKAIGAGSAEGRFDAFHAAGLTALVGRDEETDLLVRRWTTAAAGEGQVVLFSGEAGIGKSRLAVALIERLVGEPLVRTRYFCSPQNSASALHPFITQMERAAGIRHGDPAKTRIDKLSALLAQSSTSAQEVRLFASMLSLRTDGNDSTPDPGPEQRRQQTLEAIVARTQALAVRNPALIVFEDAHWSDPTSLEVLNLIVDRIRKLRALLIITFRPEFEAPWTGESHVTALCLHRLTERQSGTLIDRIENGNGLSDQIRRKIIERADGIPLFVEEMTKALLEAQGEEQGRQIAGATKTAATAVPTTLHASLMARLDRLGTAKEVAQIGAALGREFPHSLLAAVAGVPDKDLDSALERLVRSGLLFRRGVHPYRSYIFKHALVQDTAYSTLLREPRRALHARIAAVLEERFAEIVLSQPELLAHHCTEAGLIEQAAELWGKAGQRSLERSALVEAMQQLTQAIDQMETLPATPVRRGEQIKLRVALLNTLFHVRGYAAPETKAAAEQARLLLEKIKAEGEAPEDPLLPFSVLYSSWVANLVAFDSAACCDLATQFLSLAEEQAATGLRVIGHQITGISVLTVGNIAQGRAHYDRGISLYDPVAHRMLVTRFGHDSRVVMLSRRSAALWMLGYPEAALTDTELALRDAREISHAASVMYALGHGCFAHYQCGNYTTAAGAFDELIALAEEKGTLFWKEFGLMSRGCVCAATGHPADAVRLITSGFSARQSTGTTVWTPFFLSSLACAHARLGKSEDALCSIAEAIRVLETTNERWCEAEVHRAAGEIALLIPEPDSARAEACFKRSLAVARAQQAKSWELRAGTSLAKLWLDQGKPDGARDLLAPVYAWFTEGRDTMDLKQAKALLDSLS